MRRRQFLGLHLVLLIVRVVVQGGGVGEAWGGY